MFSFVKRRFSLPKKVFSPVFSFFKESFILKKKYFSYTVIFLVNRFLSCRDRENRIQDKFDRKGKKNTVHDHCYRILETEFRISVIRLYVRQIYG